MRLVFNLFGLGFFGQEHVLACFGRFTFQDCLKQFPLFFSICHASTGEEIAAFVFQMLKQMHAPFEKLSSIATDGANNMIGRDNRMTVYLKRLIQHEMGNESCYFHSIWCMSHRLNLVVGGFERVEHIKDVLKFSDRFASRRKTVSYRRWLYGQNQNASCKKIPKPSETRWCFFSVVIDALLDQTKEIDMFLSQDEDFHSFRRSMWKPDASIGTDLTEAFLNNPFILSHFKFAQSILEKICRMNSQLQQTYMTVPQAWWLIQKLKDGFARDLNEISSGNYGNFTLGRNERQPENNFQNNPHFAPFEHGHSLCLSKSFDRHQSGSSEC